MSQPDGLIVVMATDYFEPALLRGLEHGPIPDPDFLFEGSTRAVCYRVCVEDAVSLITALNRECEEWRRWLKVTAVEDMSSTLDVDESVRGINRRKQMMDGELPEGGGAAPTKYWWRILTEEPRRFLQPPQRQEDT